MSNSSSNGQESCPGIGTTRHWTSCTVRTDSCLKSESKGPEEMKGAVL